MSLAANTLSMYRTCAVEAARAIPRSAWSITALLLAYAARTVIARFAAPLGLLGGFVIGISDALFAAWILALVDQGVNGRRRIRIEDLRNNLGVYFNEVISVLFVFWIASMVLGMVSPTLLLVLMPIAIVLFNPAPEMIYQERSASVTLLGDAVKFMQQNWPEWLGAQVIGWLVLGAIHALTFGRLPTALQGVSLMNAFGPGFGFVEFGPTTFLAPTPGLGLLGGVLVTVFTLWFLLFRGHLYKQLRRSSRRGRAWQQRMR